MVLCITNTREISDSVSTGLEPSVTKATGLAWSGNLCSFSPSFSLAPLSKELVFLFYAHGFTYGLLRKEKNALYTILE